MLRKLICIILMVLVLQGCGAKFVYNNLSMISPWYVDDYIDLNKDQDKLYHQYLNELHTWHRQQELPEYKRLLSELLQHLDQDQLDAQFLSSHLSDIRQRWTLLLDQAAPALTELAVSMNDQQVIQLTDALENRNIERLERADTAQEHKAERLETIVEWMGPLTTEQTAWVEAYAAEYPDQTAISVKAHRAFQLKLKSLLQQRSNTEFEDEFNRLIANPLATPEGVVLSVNREQNLTGRITLYQSLWSSASNKQKDAVRKRLRGFIEDIESLMNTETKT